MIDVINFINAIMMIYVFDIIIIIDFFVEDDVLNVNALNFFSYSTR